jgi:FkbM family methyltransferase
MFEAMKLLFWFAVWAGRPFGGLRPRRIVHLLAQRAYGNVLPNENDFRWYRDKWGNRLLLHPHYFLDYHIIAFGAYDAELHRFIRRLIQPGMVCLDAGANIGCVAVHLANLVGPTGHIFAFEPVPQLFDRLRQNVQRLHLRDVVSLYQTALSRETGWATLKAANAYEPNQGMGSLQNTDHPKLRTEIRVPTLTLDEFSESAELTRMDLIKLDTQGAEAWIIEGGYKTLQRFQPDLLMEVSSYNLRSFERSGRGLVEMVEKLGYTCYTLGRRGTFDHLVRAVDLAVDPDIDNLYCRYNA